MKENRISERFRFYRRTMPFHLRNLSSEPHRRSKFLFTAPKTHFRIPSAVKVCPSCLDHGTVSTMSLIPCSPAIASSKSRRSSAAFGSQPTWKNWIPTYHDSASQASSFLAAWTMTDSTSSVGTPSVVTIMLSGLSALPASSLARYGFRM